MQLLLGICLAVLPFCQAWVMPIPYASRVSMLRMVEAPVGPPLQYVMTHPLNKQRPAVTMLGDPLTGDDMDAKFRRVSAFKKYSLMQLYQLYSVADGVHKADKFKEVEALYLIPGYYLLSLDDALETYSRLSSSSLDKPGTAVDGSAKYKATSDAWFPFMSSGKEKYVFINLQNGIVFERDMNSPLDVFFIEYDGITDFFQLYAELFESGKVKNGGEELFLIDEYSDKYTE